MNTHHSTRTTIKLHPGILQRLKIYADQHGKTMSAIIEQGIRSVISQSEQSHIRHVYTVLKELDGAGGRGISDASTNIDETLYGEQGSWKGKND